MPGIRDRQLAEGVLVCNFSKQLMEHDHVVTLFHEFGHLVHHVLAGGHDWSRFSGVATEWDFVEAPSQMLEEWAWDHDVLATFATDAAGEPIPAALVAKMRAAKEFGKGYYARTQMFYAATSYYLHQQVPEDLTALMTQMQAKYDLFGYVPDTHFHASFGHLQGYGSGYYTYMWSLVIAKDLFSAFDPAAMFDTGVSHRYRDRSWPRAEARTPLTSSPTSSAAPTTSTPSRPGSNAPRAEQRFVCDLRGESRRRVADESSRYADPHQVAHDPPGLEPDLDAGAAQHHSSVDDDRAFTLHVAHPVLGAHVEGPVDLEHHGATVGEVPLAVQVAAAAARITSKHLPVRGGETRHAADPPHVDLSERLSPTSDVAEGQGQVSLVAQLADLQCGGPDAFR